MGAKHSLSSATAASLAMMHLSTPGGAPLSPITSASAFSVPPSGATFAARPLSLRSKVACHAKLNKIASDFDLDAILSNEKEFSSDGEIPASTPAGRKPRRNKDTKKKKMKEQLKQEKLERQRLKKMQKEDAEGNSGGSFDGSADDEDTGIDYESLMREIDFVAHTVPASLEGKRVDAALVELINEESDGGHSQASNAVPISRSQCDRILPHQCVYEVPPEKAADFSSALQKEFTADGGKPTVPYSLIEQHGSLIQCKSHALEPGSILIYPSRDSLLSTSSSATLLSNLVPPTEIIAQNIPLDVLFEDEHMIVVNKRAGMVVHPAAGNWDGTLVNALAHYLTNESPFGAGEFFTDSEQSEGTSDDSKVAMNDDDVNQNDAVTNSVSTLRPGIVHRLDKGTTGVLVVAKTSSALATLSEAFAERRVKKQYLAVAIGNPGEDQWINKPIGRHPLHRQKMRVVPDPSASMPGRQARLTGPTSTSVAKQGRPALSHIHTIHYDGKLSVVQVKIATGRTHQIRVHLQDHGTPIYGDDVYGLSDWNKSLSRQRGITRPLLHAQRLKVEHPVTGEPMVFEAEVADDLMGVIKAIWPADEEIEF
ncbi:hypothetical protein ACHAXT_006843 [Thalassiosira profunda]